MPATKPLVSTQRRHKLQSAVMRAYHYAPQTILTPHPLGIEISTKVDAQDKKCFMNAILGLDWISTYYKQLPYLYYAEGWATKVGLGMPMYHGWIMGRIEDRVEVLELTPSWLAGWQGDHRIVYDAAALFPLTDLRWMMARRESLTLPVLDNPWAISDPVVQEKKKEQYDRVFPQFKDLSLFKAAPMMAPPSP